MNLVIITGGSKGLGKALVDIFSSHKWTVAELSRSGTSKHNIRCNLVDQKQVSSCVEKLFEKIKKQKWNQVVLINNAGDLKPIKFVSYLTPIEIAENITLNQISAFTVISEFMRVFRNEPTSKNIANISSGAALKGYAGWSLYCASKAACENYIDSISQEEEQNNNPFSAVNYNPGIIDTNMQENIRKSDISHFPAKDRFAQYKENGDLVSPESVANHLTNLIFQGIESGIRYSYQD